MSEDEIQWYGVRCILRLTDGDGWGYEERITLWRARSFEQAAELAGREARRYAEDFPREYLDYCESYWIDREIFELNAEVFSSLRESDLDPQEYIDTFFSTDREHSPEIWPSNRGGGELPWYGVRCLYLWVDWDNQPFEERITLWRATSADHAVQLAEQEAVQYTEDSGIEYLGFSQAYGPCEEDEVREGMVVFSLLRDSDLLPEDYINTFFNTGREYVRPDGD